MSFTVRVALPGEYAEAGRVTAEGYHADELLRRPDGLIDFDYEAQMTDASGRAREAELLVAVDDGQVLGTVTWCPPSSPWRELATRSDQAEFRMLSVAPAGRRRGVGRALVNACLDRARAQGMREVLIFVTSDDCCPRALPRVRLCTRSGLDNSPKPHVRLWALRLNLPL